MPKTAVAVALATLIFVAFTPGASGNAHDPAS
jgi:hypothetical protein